MKQIIVIILMCLMMSCSWQEQDATNRVIYDKKEGYWIEKDCSGILISEGLYENGIKEGYWKEYSIDPPTKFEGEYKEGKRNGDWYLISTIDGTKLDFQKYDNGKKSGGATLSW